MGPHSSSRLLPRPVAALAGLVILAALTLLSLYSVTPPAARPASAPAGDFSAARAFAHVQQYATAPHPVGAATNDTVRDYLVATLRGYGLQTEVQDTLGIEQHDSSIGGGGGAVSMAHVRNVVAVLPGAAPTGRVILVAHYDSVQNGPGANDDGAGVSSILEVARALTATGFTPRNDIVFVLTDAEEACLCGAEAFAGQDTYAKKGGVVLNLEARGGSGPPIMFETSDGNAKLVDVYGRYAPHPVGTSFAVEVYRILPNDTDFTAFMHQGGFTGLNAAYIDNSALYHAPEDTAANVDTGSVQAHGDNALALAKAFAGLDLAGYTTPAGYDETYFPVFVWLFDYPGFLAWPIAILALLTVVAFGWRAVRSGRTTGRRIAAGFGLALVPLLVAAVVAQLFWLLLTAVRPAYANLIDPWRAGWFRIAVTALVATVVLTWYGLSRRRVGAVGLWVGALGWLAVLGVVFAAVVPGGSYLGAIPALAGGLAGLVALWARGRAAGGIVAAGAPVPAVADAAGVTRGELIAIVLGGLPAVIILAPTVLLFFPALGLATGAAAAFFAAMLGLAVVPAWEWLYPAVDAEPAERRRFPRAAAVPALVAGVLAIACTITGFAVDRFDDAHPIASQLMYALDADTNTAVWASSESTPGAWTSHYVGRRRDLSGEFPILDDDLAVGPAQVANLPAPTVTEVADVTAGNRRTLTMKVTSHRDVRMSYFEVRGVRVIGATVDGRELPADAVGGSSPFAVLFHAPPGGELVVTLVIDATAPGGTGPVTVRVLDGSDGLTALPGFVPRPSNVSVEGTHTSDLVVVAKTATLP